MKTKRNPVTPRLEYVFKNFPAGVGYMVTWAWLEAVGADELAEELRRNVAYGSRVRPTNANVRFQSLGTVKEAIKQGAPSTTPYDRHLPWLAKTVHDIFKPSLKAIKKDLKTGGGEHKGDLLDVLTFVLWPSGDGTNSFKSALSKGTLDAIRWAHADAAEMASRFRAITQWADAEGVDLPTSDNHLILSESEEWGAAELANEGVEAGDVVYTFSDGWTVQSLWTAGALGDEGIVMQHCVGSYHPLEDEIYIYSLRDPQGRPHATMEWNRALQYVDQLKGKQNVEPNWEYFLRMVEFRANVLAGESGAVLTKVSFNELPASATQLKSKLKGAYLVKGEIPDSTLLVYSDDSVMVLADLDSFVLDVEKGCRDETWSEARDADNATSLNRCVASTLSDTKPTDISGTYLEEGEAEGWLQWEIWVRQGVAYRHSDDEMISYLAWKTPDEIKEARAMARSNSKRSAANPRGVRGRKISHANPMASLKKKLMR